ncbi:hypothetical protein [Prolixibacter sp. NT017]|uniref:hypothetical protein n=1 Tax=Prolixibacter sp. NT017 TaxID=2652390 RepID=UPI001278FE8C|nr:hypothetical protein [Prolixibacter sp. NT017]GET27045.1 hypothetical protein NT017_33740 [Prolixibacter sp. NT017]
MKHMFGKKKLWFLVVLLGIALLNSCSTGEFNFDKMAGPVNWKPSLYLPLAHGNYTVQDFVDKIDDPDSLLQSDSNNLLHIIYTEDSIYQFDAASMVNFPANQTIQSDAVTVDSVQLADASFTSAVTLDALTLAVPSLTPLRAYDGQSTQFPAASTNNAGSYYPTSLNSFQQVTFQNGTLSLTMVNNYPVEVSATFTLVDPNNLSTSLQFVFSNVASGGTQTQTVSLANVSLSDQLHFNLTSFSTPGSTTAVPIRLADELQLNFQITNAVLSQGSVMIPDQDVSSTSGEYTFSINGLNNQPVKVFKTEVKSGVLAVDVNSTVAAAGRVRIELPTAMKNGQPAVFDILTDGTQASYHQEFDLSGYTIDLTQGANQNYNVLPYTSSVHLFKSPSYVNINPTDQVSFSADMNNIQVGYIEGDLGQESITIDPGSFQFNIGGLSNLNGNVQLPNPKLSLKVTSSVGVPATLNANFKGYNTDGQTADLNPSPMAVPYPTSRAQGTINDTITYDNGNSDIVNFISLPPDDKIEYSGTVSFNPNGAADPATPNFITDQSKLMVGLMADLPLEIQSQGFDIHDTLDVNMDNVDQVDSVTLVMNITNGIPLDFQFEMAFIDTLSGTQYGNPISSETISAAQTDEQGNYQQPTITQTEIVLSPDQINDLNQSNGIALRVHLASPNQGLTPARIYSDSPLNVSLGVKVRANLNK